MIIVSIYLLAIFFRFYNYSNRFRIAYDQAQFAVVARYALESLQLPLLGPFSSGGPFQTGGEWYWIVMLGTIFFPFSFLAPWVFLTIVASAYVIVLSLIGYYYKGIHFGYIVGLFAAIAIAPIIQSTNLTNQTPIILFSSLVMLFSLLYIKSEKLKWFFLASLTVGISATVHIQSVALFPMVFFLFFFVPKEAKKKLLFFTLGIALPWIPVLLADSQHNFYNTKSMITYFWSDQAKVPYEVLGRRWLTFITDFIPTVFSELYGGEKIFGYFQIGLLLLAGGIVLFKKELNKTLIFFVFSVISMFAILRYTRTPLFESFYIFIQPLLVFFIAWATYRIYTANKYLGIVVASLLLIFSVVFVFNKISIEKNEMEILNITQQAILDYVDTSTISIYDRKFETRRLSMPTVLLFQSNGKLGEDGIKIGICSVSDEVGKKYPVVFSNQEYRIVDLSEVDPKDLKTQEWGDINPKTVYQSTQWWFISPRNE